MVTSTRPRDKRVLMRRLIAGSTDDSSEPTRRWISRNLLLTVLRSTDTEKSSPVTMPRPYPVIDFMNFLAFVLFSLEPCFLRFVLCCFSKARIKFRTQWRVLKEPRTKYKAQKKNLLWNY